LKNDKKVGKIVANILFNQWIAVFLGVLILGIVLSIIEPVFFDINNFKNILLTTSTSAIIAVGMTFVIMTGGIDISVGMSLFLIMSLMWKMTGILPVPLIFVFGIVVGLAVGAVNGLLICKFNIPTMIATLATYTICRGIGYWTIDSKLKMVEEPLRGIGTGNILGIPTPIVIMVLVCIAGWYLQSYTRIGRYILAVGDNETSARESGLNVKSIRLIAYLICGICVGIAAVIMLGRLGAVQTDTGYGVEFTVITAVVIGGTKLSGGRGTVIGSVIGAIFLTLINNGLNLLEVSAFIYEIVTGAVLAVAITIDLISTKKHEAKYTSERVAKLNQS